MSASAAAPESPVQLVEAVNVNVVSLTNRLVPATAVAVAAKDGVTLDQVLIMEQPAAASDDLTTEKQGKIIKEPTIQGVRNS